MTATIPEKYYVTIRYRKDITTGLLGFASPYTKDKAFEKRKITQDSWAYSYGASFTIYDDDSIVGEFAKHSKYDAVMLFSANCYPKIIDNTLIDGFEIAKSVKWSGFGGKGNLVWCILDPRGFELEISSDNFARIVDCTTIINGVIQGKCCWGREGADNILLPEASDDYQEAHTKTNKIANKISLSDIAPGDTVELLNKGHENKEVTYYGYYTFVLVTTNNHNQYDPVKIIADSTVNRYLFKDNAGNYFVVWSPKIAAVIKPHNFKFNKTQFINDFNATNSGHLSDLEPVLFITDSKFDRKQASFSLQDSGFILTSDIPKIHHYIKPMIIDYKEKLWILSEKYDDASWSFESIPVLKEINRNALIDGQIKFNTVDGSPWGKTKITINVINLPNDIDLTYKVIVIKYKDHEYRVNNIGWYYAV